MNSVTSTPFIKPVRPNIFKFILQIFKIWNSNVFTNSGTQLLSFKEELSAYLNLSSNPAISANGTTSEIALLKLIASNSSKKEVITTPYSFISSASSIIHAGLTPVFVDIDSDLSLCVNQVKAAITDNTLAIVSADIYGIPNKHAEINTICENQNIIHVSDKSHSFGVLLGGLSSFHAAHFCFASMHATKVMSAVEGGIIVSNSNCSPSISDVDTFNNFGFQETDSKFIGFNAKMDEMRAAFGRLNLAQLDRVMHRRKLVFENYLYYGLGEYVFPYFLDLHNSFDNQLNYSYLPVLLRSSDRTEFLAQLKDIGINIKLYFDRIIPSYSSYLSNPDLWLIRSSTNLVNARNLSDSIITLPVHQDVPGPVIRSICSLITSYSPYNPFEPK